MAHRFSQSDWELVRSRAAEVAAQLRAKGAHADDFTPLPPVPSSQVTDFARSTGLALPPDFVDLVTKYAGGWRFYWHLGVGKKYHIERWVKPPVFVGHFGGNGEVPFIGAGPTRSLLQEFTEFQSELDECGPEEPEMREIARKSFPLHTFEGGEGDKVVLRLDLDPARVCLLDHEAGWEFRDEFIICEGFSEFVTGWAALGFPECRWYTQWVDAERRRPMSSGLKYHAWLAWLADPSAV